MVRAMRITKFGHACVRLEHEGTVVVIDPGVFTDPEAMDGATAVLITHEHPDHFHPDNLAATDAPIHTIEAVAAKVGADAPDLAERVTVDRAGVDLRRGRAGPCGRRAARGHPPGDPPAHQLRLPAHPGRHERLPPRRRPHRARRAGRRAAGAIVRAVAAQRDGHRLRARGRSPAQPGDPRPGLQRGRPRRSWPRRWRCWSDRAGRSGSGSPTARTSSCRRSPRAGTSPRPCGCSASSSAAAARPRRAG